TLFDGVVGGTLTLGSCTIMAADNFPVGQPLILINIPHGAKGAWVMNMKLDGNNRASAGIEYAAGTQSTANIYDVSVQNCDTIINTNDNCQSVVWERVVGLFGIEIGLKIGSNNRHMTARDCRFGGTIRA